MRARLFVVVIVLVFAASAAPLFAQERAPQTPARVPGMGAPPPQQPEIGAQVPPTAPVITVEGYCATPGASPCQTVITKGDFEKLAKALDPNMQAQGRGSLADQYSKIMVMAGEAKKHNLESDPRSQEILRFLQMQILANIYNQSLQDKAKEVPAADVEKYYNDHKSEFEEVTLKRIYIPKNVPPDAKKMSDVELTALANDIDKRAKAGEDFATLQKEVFDKMGIKSTPPPTDMGAQRQANFSPEERQAIFALAPNQVSDALPMQIGYFIYKVASKRAVTLEEAKAEISSTLQRQRYTQALSDVFANVNVKLNPDYFGANAAVNMPGRPPAAMPPPPGAAPAPPKPATRPPN